MNSLQDHTQDLDRYITQMRGTFTQQVIGPAKQTQLDISMDPGQEKHPAVPFPATFTRLVNEKFGKGRDFSINIISDSPINPKQGLKT
ncbi:MAG: hypothetical protein GWM98_17080, partial [Nitrospinaceae bacterium]|nr:DUF3365 domain-containing protein [Nitrospinaceae bacterium]NIR55891.1 DUF3365 domain-containing protein [Nitrospinaceae bacterium]NIS86337.1 DUF3365 domain-containing protein [Nitrospinaceae bacterium]NIT83173.1 DUF3365 domain-containing protein [Nitrospinaceae bacterium]NIU45382.1 DUF3365 domain-containing protein [Nitrospinaceae bacterium]